MWQRLPETLKVHLIKLWFLQQNVENDTLKGHQYWTIRALSNMHAIIPLVTLIAQVFSAFSHSIIHLKISNDHDRIDEQFVL